MKRNVNSITARLYRDFYAFSGSDKMPKSLCPYFWRLMLMWVCIVPLALFSIVGFMFEIGECIYRKQLKDFPIYASKDRSLGSLAIYAFLLLVYCMGVSVVGVFHQLTYTSWFGTAHFVGNFINSILLIALVIWFFGRTGGPFNEPIVSSYIKAKYKKICPKIDWENK